jgi:phospholipase C
MRRLLAVVFAIASVGLLAPSASAAPATAGGPAASSPDSATKTPIKHVVMLMQDNHSFDNYFGTYPGADGIPAGTCQRLRLTRSTTEGCVKPFRLGTMTPEDLSQGIGVQKRQYDGGKMDGFVAAYRRLGLEGTTAMGYYDGRDIPYAWNVAKQYVLFDRFFGSTAVGSRESYLYWVAGKAPESRKPLTDSKGYDALPTIFDRLAARKVTAKFYVENLDSRLLAPGAAKTNRASQLVKVPLLSMNRFKQGGPLAGTVVDLSEYYRDVRNGTLPAVSYIVTTGSSENPPGRVGAGQKAVRKLTSELIRSRYWSSSAFMWSYDGWGGWFDHVAPPQVDERGYGFRVPALLLSPYARRGVVDHTVMDYTAMLKFVETNWGLAPLASRDARSAGLMSAFDFTAGPRPAAFVATTYGDPPEVVNRGRTSGIIYALYGGAMAATSYIALAAFVGLRRPLYEGRHA